MRAADRCTWSAGASARRAAHRRRPAGPADRVADHGRRPGRRDAVARGADPPAVGLAGERAGLVTQAYRLMGRPLAAGAAGLPALVVQQAGDQADRDRREARRRGLPRPGGGGRPVHREHDRLPGPDVRAALPPAAQGQPARVGLGEDGRPRDQAGRPDRAAARLRGRRRRHRAGAACGPSSTWCRASTTSASRSCPAATSACSPAGPPARLPGGSWTSGSSSTLGRRRDPDTGREEGVRHEGPRPRRPPPRRPRPRRPPPRRRRRPRSARTPPAATAPQAAARWRRRSSHRPVTLAAGGSSAAVSPDWRLAVVLVVLVVVAVVAALVGGLGTERAYPTAALAVVQLAVVSSSSRLPWRASGCPWRS